MSDLKKIYTQLANQLPSRVAEGAYQTKNMEFYGSVLTKEAAEKVGMEVAREVLRDEGDLREFALSGRGQNLAAWTEHYVLYACELWF